MADLRRLRIEAERCFRLAQGIADPKLCDELEAIGREFGRLAELRERETLAGSATSPVSSNSL